MGVLIHFFLTVIFGFSYPEVFFVFLSCSSTEVFGICSHTHLSNQGFKTRREDRPSKDADKHKSYLLHVMAIDVADNVKSISQVHVHLPGPGNDQWASGQLLITTQDSASIPLTSSFIRHISVKRRA